MNEGDLCRLCQGSVTSLPGVSPTFPLFLSWFCALLEVQESLNAAFDRIQMIDPHSQESDELLACVLISSRTGVPSLLLGMDHVSVRFSRQVCCEVVAAESEATGDV